MTFVKFKGELEGSFAYVDADKVSAITASPGQVPDVVYLVVEGQVLKVGGTAEDALIDLMRARADGQPLGWTADNTPAPF